MSNVIGAVFSIKDQFSGVIEKIIGAAKKSEQAIKQSSSVVKDFGKGFDVKSVSVGVEKVEENFSKVEKSADKATTLVSARVEAMTDAFEKSEKGIGESTKRVSARVEAMTNAFEKSEKGIGQSTKLISARVQAVTDDFEETSKKANSFKEKLSSAFKKAGDDSKKFGDNASGGFQKAANGAKSLVVAIGITKALSSAFNLVKGSLDSAFTRIDTMENFKRVMTTITGSSEKTKKSLDDLSEGVTGTAYGLDVAAKSTQDFVTRGLDINKATSRVIAWGDAVAFYGDGSNEQFSRVNSAIADMTSTGKVGGQELRSLYDAGINAPKMYADVTGKSVSEVEKALSKGSISTKDFLDVVEDAMMNGTGGVQKIAGAAKDAGASWGASFDNMKAAVARGTIKIIESIDEMLTSNGLPDMRSMVSMFGKKFEGALKSAAEKVPDVVNKLQELYSKLQENGAIDIVKSALEGVKDTVVLFKDAIVLAKDNMNLLLPVIAGVAGAMAAMKVIGIVSALYGLWTSGTIAQTVAQWALNTAMLANPLTWIVVGIGAVIAIGVALYMNWDVVKAKSIELWGALTSKFSSIKESVNTSVESMRKWVSDKWQSVQDKCESVTNWVKDKWNSVTYVFDNVKNKVSDMAETVKEKWDSVKTFLKNPIKGTVNLVQTGSVGGVDVDENYAGTNHFRGGLTSIHERGGEIMDLPSGTRIYPHDKSVQMARDKGRSENTSQGSNITITINGMTIREEADVGKVANELLKKIKETDENMP